MIEAAEAVVWINRDTKEVMIWSTSDGLCRRPPGYQWSDPIGAAYMQWRKQSTNQRMQTMTETAIDLAMQGFAMWHGINYEARVKLGE